MNGISENDIDEAIAFTAENHPEYSISQFAADFREMIGREPTFKEKQAFQKEVNKTKKNFNTSGSFKQLSLTSKVINGYSFGESLGKGSFGEVYKGEKDGRYYAVKKINETKMAAEIEQLFADSVSARLNSVFLVRYFDKFRTPDGILYLVMELCEKGDLRARIEKLKEIGAVFTVETMIKIFIQLVLGLDTLHMNKFLHRDLKPENIYIDQQDHTKLGDFGCAKELDVTSAVASTMIGTPVYESPQIVQGQKYDASADMWALGVLLYEMCTLERPFSASNTYLLHQAIIAGKYKEIPPGRIPSEIIEIVRSLLSLDSKKRPSARSLLRDPFLQKHAAQIGYTSSKKLLAWFPPETLGGGDQTAGDSSSFLHVLPSFASSPSALKPSPSALTPSPQKLQISPSSIAPIAAVAAPPITIVSRFPATPKAAAAPPPVDFVPRFSAAHKADAVVLSAEGRVACCVHEAAPDRDSKVSIAVLVGTGTGKIDVGSGAVSVTIKLERPDDYAYALEEQLKEYEELEKKYKEKKKEWEQEYEEYLKEKERYERKEKEYYEAKKKEEEEKKKEEEEKKLGKRPQPRPYQPLPMRDPMAPMEPEEAPEAPAPPKLKRIIWKREIEKDYVVGVFSNMLRNFSNFSDSLNNNSGFFYSSKNNCVYSDEVKLADSKCKAAEIGDTIRLDVDIARGSVRFSVNGAAVADIADSPLVRGGVYVVVGMRTGFAAFFPKWVIV